MTTTETSPQLAAALLYGALGWPVVPLFTPTDGVCDCPQSWKDENRCTPGKHPRTRNGLDDASTDETKIRRWWQMFPNANIGIDLARAGLVDIAPDSLEWFAEFTARGLPKTLSFASGGGEGHAHHLYARPEGCDIHRNCQTGKYDVMSNGYAVMPPSLHVSGRTYTWLEPADGMVLSTAQIDAPDWGKAMLARHHRPRTAPSDVEPDDDVPPVRLSGDALERWYGRLYETKPDGSVDRSYSLWWIAVNLLEAGCRARFVEHLLAERDLALGWNKFTQRDDAIERYSIIVERAAESSGPGRVRLNGHVRVEKAPSKAQQRLRFRTLSQLVADEDEDVTWFTTGILGESLITELDGKAKRSGKTTLLLSMVRAILRGEPFFGQPTTYTSVVYLTEQSGPSFKRNLQRAGLLEGEDMHILTWGDTQGWTWADIVADAFRKCADVGAHVLIIDTLAQFSGVRGDDENKSGAALEVMEPLQAAAKFKVAILISRHDRKSGGSVGDSGRGSSAYAGAVDIILHLDRPEPKPGTERQRVLEGISRFEETPDNLLIELSQDEPQAYAVMGDLDQLRQRDLRVDVLASLPTDAADAIDREELVKRTAGRAIDVARTVKELIEEHLVVVVMLKPEGRQRASQHFYQRVWDTDDA